MSRDTRETRNLLYPLDPSHMYGSERFVKPDPMLVHGKTNDQRKNELNSLCLRCSESGAQEFHRLT